MTVMTVNSTAYAMNNNLENMLNQIDEKIKDKTDLSYSSNPYDYIEGNEYYNNILQLGVDALPLIIEEIEASDEAGLKEYILSCAVQDISGVDIADVQGEWVNSQEFIEKYEVFLRNVKDSVNVIVSSNSATNAEKIERLQKYGIYAVPYLKKINSKTREGNIAQKSIKQINKEFVKDTKFENLSQTDLNIIETLVDDKVE